MKLDRVTITGADDSIAPYNLVMLSERFPFVEWGILLSRSNAGEPRYPSHSWIKALQMHARDTTSMQLSLHICGSWVRQLLLGYNDVPSWMFDCFRRIQLNFHAEKTECRPAALHGVLRDLSLPHRQFIFQIDGAKGNEHLKALFRENEGREPVDAVGLFDRSGGAGVLPDAWPKPCIEDPNGALAYHGYAGGLGPANLAEELPKIGAAAGDCRFWIDMETRVRSSNDRQFDLLKVEAALAIASEFAMEAAR